MNERLLVRVLSDDELLRIDPTGKARQHMTELMGSPFRSPANKYVSEKARNKILGIMDERFAQLFRSGNDNVRRYAEWAYPARDKVAQQGGRYEFNVLLESLRAYYIPRPYARCRTIDLGLQYMRNKVCEARNHRKDDDYALALMCYQGVTGTSAGLTTMAKKGSYQAETSIDQSRAFDHLDPAVPGERIIKNKKRVIFMDAIKNVRLIERILFKAKEVLKSIFPCFDGWKNPDFGLRKQITDALLKRAVNIETDQTAMDQHFSKEVVFDYVLPLYEVILPEEDYLILAAYCEEAFEQELFMGTVMWSGKHNLFSGQPITNDFETIVHAMGYFGALIEEYAPSVIPYHSLVCQGDDVGLLVVDSPARVCGSLMPRIYDAFQSLGFELSEQKARCNTGDFSFCKKYYNLKMPRTALGSIGGAYSPYYAINSVVFPEREPISRGTAAVAALQISDNLQYTPYVSQYYDWLAHSTDFVWSFDSDDIDYVTVRDWWFKVYGEHWNPAVSFSFQEILKRLAK